MKIVSLSSNNFKRLKAVELKLEDQNLIVVSGENGQGKSSLIDSIYTALAGASNLPEKPIHEGEESAEVEVELAGTSSKGDPLRFKVKRTFTEKGSYLTVITKDGNKFTNPQVFLDTIVGQLSFDPLEFIRMKSKDQVSLLTKAVGIDLAQEDQNIKEYTSERLTVGRQMKMFIPLTDETHKQAIETLEAIKDLPSSKDLIDAITIATNDLREYQEKLKRKESLLIRISEIKKELSEAENEIQSIDAIQKPTADISKLQTDLSKLEEMQKNKQFVEKSIDEHNRHSELKKKYDDFTNLIDDCNKRKAAQLASITMPIPGLTWNEESILYGGIPFEQASDAEKLKISIGIAMKLNPNLRIILVKDGSLLDKKNLAIIEEMAGKNEFQIWMEKVDDSGEIGVYIEDGEVKVNNL